MGWSPTVTRLLTAAGTTTAVYSLFTRYELGVVKLLPMKAHLAMDAVQGGMLMAAGALLEDEEDDVRMALGAIGGFEIAVTALTQPRPPCPAGRYAGASHARPLTGTHGESYRAVHLPITRGEPESNYSRQLVGEDI
jgi:hypothetical protein